ncbi:hypothetical protein ACFWC9_28975 [Streptomyces goshikiensis]|uniref:hypothetical protein n=1 Tax=Streptomyces goshikiensis TaxID=1942 RepID=UPI0036B95C5C
MTELPPAGPNWTAMTEGDFDTAAPATLPVSTGPVRTYATPDDHGTPALFGEQPPQKPVRRPQPAAVDLGQEGLF